MRASFDIGVVLSGVASGRAGRAEHDQIKTDVKNLILQQNNLYTRFPLHNIAIVFLPCVG